MICPKCGVQNEDDAVFCAGCGEKLENAADASTENTQDAVSADGETNAAEESGEVKEETVQEESSQIQSGDYSASYASAEAPAMADEKKGNAGKYIPAAVGVVILLVVILAAKALFGGSYKDPIKSLCKNLNKQETNLDKYADVVLPKFAMDAYKDAMKVAKNSDGGDDFMDEIEESLEDVYDGFEDDYGDGWKVSYEISKKTKLDKDELEDIQDAYGDLRDYLDYFDEDAIDELVDEDYISKSDGKTLEKCIEKLDKGLKKIKISKGYKVKAKMKIEGDDDDDKETMEIYVVKANGKWVIDITNGGSTTSLYSYLSYLY